MPSKKTKRMYDLSTMRVVVFDQFPFMSELMSTMLKEFDIKHVTTTTATTEVMNILERSNMYGPQSGQIDILITDWVPPKGQGIELLKWARIHAVESIRYLPVLFCTNYAHQKAVEQVRDSGATEMLVKPVSAKKLAQRLTYIIDKPRPFIRSRHYLGPDRRRLIGFDYEGKERRVNELTLGMVDRQSK